MDDIVEQKEVKKGLLVRTYGQFFDRSLILPVHLQSIRWPSTRDDLIDKGREKK